MAHKLLENYEIKMLNDLKNGGGVCCMARNSPSKERYTAWLEEHDVNYILIFRSTSGWKLTVLPIDKRNEYLEYY